MRRKLRIVLNNDKRRSVNGRSQKHHVIAQTSGTRLCFFSLNRFFCPPGTFSAQITFNRSLIEFNFFFWYEMREKRRKVADGFRFQFNALPGLYNFFVYEHMKLSFLIFFSKNLLIMKVYSLFMVF